MLVLSVGVVHVMVLGVGCEVLVLGVELSLVLCIRCWAWALGMESWF